MNHNGERGSCRRRLDWEQRLAILLGAVCRVTSIHSVGPSSCHGNIKASYILLTGNHEVCVSEHCLKTLVSLCQKGSGYHVRELADYMSATRHTASASSLWRCSPVRLHETTQSLNTLIYEGGCG